MARLNIDKKIDLKKLDKLLSDLLEIEIKGSWVLKDSSDIVVFQFERNGDDVVGLYSTQLNKIIYEPDNCSDEEYHTEFNLISIIPYRSHTKLWFNREGEILFSGGNVLKAFSNDIYLIIKEDESFFKDRLEYSRDLIRPNLNDDHDENNRSRYSRSIITTGVIDATEDEDGMFMMIRIENDFKEILIGIYDIKKLKWVLELQNIGKSTNYN